MIKIVASILFCASLSWGQLTPSPTHLDFTQPALVCSNIKPVVFTNTGQKPVTIGNITIQQPFYAVPAESRLLPPGGHLTVDVWYCPVSTKEVYDTLIVSYSGNGGHEALVGVEGMVLPGIKQRN